VTTLFVLFIAFTYQVCLTCTTLHMLKQLIVVTFSWKTTVIYSKFYI